MRRIIAAIALSRDGFIEGPGGELDWITLNEDVAYANDFIKNFDTIFYGRKAYEKVGIPYLLEEPQDPGKQAFNNTVNSMRKYVFSRSVKHVEGNGMVINESALRWEVNRISDEEGKNIWLCGGAKIIHTFTVLGLIDELSLVIHPVILGNGKPLFANNNERSNLKLINTRNLKSGVVIRDYQPKDENKLLRYGRSF